MVRAFNRGQQDDLSPHDATGSVYSLPSHVKILPPPASAGPKDALPAVAAFDRDRGQMQYVVKLASKLLRTTHMASFLFHPRSGCGLAAGADT
jgi:hypothetical protein